MIKIKRKFMKSISMILVFSMILSLFYSQPVFATSNIDIISSLLDYEVDSEEIAEAMDDATSLHGNMDWKTATEVDKLPWNYFHNQVEKEIRKKYYNQGIGQNELMIDLRYSLKDEESGIGKAGELTGKKGKADL